MIDIKKIRENPEYFRKATADKQRDPKLVDEALKIDGQRKEIMVKVEVLRAQRNKLGKEDIERGKQIKIDLSRLEADLSKIDQDLKNVLWKLPNPAKEDVPVGKDESENVEVKKWGEIPKLEFPIKAHFELGESLGLIDTQRASKVSGTRFGYLRNEAVLLEFALIRYGLDLLLKKGFSPVLPPVMIKDEIMAELGYNNYGFKETYCLAEDKLCLVATAEHSILPFYKDEVLTEEELPKRFVGFSTAFRREAGSYGKDTKGIFRVHQFNKLEMICWTKPEDSDKEHELMLSIEEELMQCLKIPYQVTKMCTGDLGDPAARKYDINAWFPSENKYRETHSTSTCTDYQSRRLNTKYKKKTGELEFVHILNGTIFSERPILAILENYQQKDGSVKVPEVLQSYLGKEVISPR